MKPNKQVAQNNRITSLICAVYHDIAVKSGLSDCAFNILYSLAENDGERPQSDIVKDTGISRQTVNSALRKLEKDGITYLKQGVGRNTVVCLTEKGLKLAENKITPVMEAEGSVFASWSQDELNSYFGLQLRFLNQLKAKVDLL